MNPMISQSGVNVFKDKLIGDIGSMKGEIVVTIGGKTPQQIVEINTNSVSPVTGRILQTTSQPSLEAKKP